MGSVLGPCTECHRPFASQQVPGEAVRPRSHSWSVVVPRASEGAQPRCRHPEELYSCVIGCTAVASPPLVAPALVVASLVSCRPRRGRGLRYHHVACGPPSSRLLPLLARQGSRPSYRLAAAVGSHTSLPGSPPPWVPRLAGVDRLRDRVLFASFDDTFVHVSDLSGRVTIIRGTGGVKVEAGCDESPPYAAMLRTRRDRAVQGARHWCAAHHAPRHGRHGD